MAASEGSNSRALPVVVLTLSSAANALLALYQWMELLAVRGGGTAVCSLNEQVNCTAVWNSDFAGKVHDLVGLPVAGLGLVWSVTALLITVRLTWSLLQGRDVSVVVAAVKAWGVLGFFTVVAMAAASFSIGAVCLTCLGTYALVCAYVWAALFPLAERGLPATPLLLKGLVTAAVFAVPLHLAMLYPGRLTPKATGTALGAGPEKASVAAYFNRLTPPERDGTVTARAEWLKNAQPDASAFPARARVGPAEAPTKVVEFTDILCPHCRQLVHVLHELDRVVPGGKLSVEARMFPLDPACNAVLTPAPPGSGSSPDSVRCVGAKAQICLESAPDAQALRIKLFDAQEGLTKERLLEIASSGSVKRDQLEACIASPETDAKLKQDVEYGRIYEPTGTPILVVNGRRTYPVPPFLYGMAISDGDVDNEYFKALAATSPGRAPVREKATPPSAP